MKSHDRQRYTDIGRLERDGPVPLLPPVPGTADRASLHIAIVIPTFQQGSGGHSTIFRMARRWEEAGHTCSVWIHDPAGDQDYIWPAVARQLIREGFEPLEAPVFKDFSKWYGADVAVATSWDTVYPVLGLDQTRARAYLVQDHEPEFHATSADSYWAAKTYTLGLPAIAASPWLRDMLVERYGASASSFDLGVDHDVYFPADTQRRETVVFYSRMSTDRRAVPLGLLALEELVRRRPHVSVQLFGNQEPLRTAFEHEHLGVVSHTDLARLYSSASVGLCLSMTNHSLIPQEMMACGLPCVELAGFGNEPIYGLDGPVELAEFDSVALADALERLLDDRELWERRSAAGLEFVQGKTWDRAAEQVEAGFRAALREREPAPSPIV